MSDIKVSVIVPMYKCEDYLPKCVESILSQSVKEIELILVDDGSPDDSGKIAETYAGKDSRVKVLRQKNQGPGASRQRGIEVAKGEYIGFVDSDDWIDACMYERLYSSAKKNNSQIAMCSYVEEHSDRSVKVIHPYNNDDVLDKTRIVDSIIASFSTNENYGYYSLWNKIYKKDWLEKNDLRMNENRRHGEDWWFNLEAFSLADNVVFIKDAYYHYMKLNPNSLMHKYNEDQFELIVSGRKHQFDILLRNNINVSKHQVELDQRFIEECIGFIYKVIAEEKNWKKASLLINSVLIHPEFQSALENYSSNSTIRKMLVALFKRRLLLSARLLIFSIEKTKRFMSLSR